jgi:hypothetical protein
MPNYVPSKGSGRRKFIPPLIWDQFPKSHLGNDLTPAKFGGVRQRRYNFRLLNTLFGLHLELQNVDQFLINMVKVKLRYWSSIHLLLVGRTLMVNMMVNP